MVPCLTPGEWAWERDTGHFPELTPSAQTQWQLQGSPCRHSPPCLSLPAPGESFGSHPPHPCLIWSTLPGAVLCGSVFLRCYHLFLANDIHRGLHWASLLSFPSPCPYRYPTAAQASLAHCVSHAQGVQVECAQAMGNAKTGFWAVGNVAAKRASMEQPVRCVSWAAMDPPALEVRPA